MEPETNLLGLTGPAADRADAVGEQAYQDRNTRGNLRVV